MDHLLAADSWVRANPYAMLAIGLATAHRRAIFHWAILAVLKVAPVRRVLLGRPDEVLAVVDDFRAELKTDLDEAAAKADLGKAAKAQPQVAAAHTPQ